MGHKSHGAGAGLGGATIGHSRVHPVVEAARDDSQPETGRCPIRFGPIVRASRAFLSMNVGMRPV
jgi:hypothetical protein